MSAAYYLAKKRFGQHFLRDRNIIDIIVALINPLPGEALVEIGPGMGALTKPVVACSGHLTVIELDRDLAGYLAQHPRLKDLVTIYQQDVLDTNFSALAVSLGQPLKIFGNLPYNISTPLLFILFNHIAHIQEMYFMLQAEVVERLCAEPNSKAYGRLSVLAQYFCRITSRLSVASYAFDPEPKVDSAVVCLTPYRDKPYPVKDFSHLQRVCSQAFNQRRKTIRNSLHPLFTAQQLLALGIDPKLRAENLTVAQYCRLADHWGMSESLSE